MGTACSSMAKARIERSKVEHDFDPDILFYFGCYIPSTATFFRRRVIEQGHLLDCDYRVCMDFEYFVRLASAGFKFHYVPQFIAAFRWHDSNVSLQQVERGFSNGGKCSAGSGRGRGQRWRWRSCGRASGRSGFCGRLSVAMRSES